MKKNLEPVMSLKLLELIHVGTQDPLHDIGLGAVLGRLLTPKTYSSSSLSARSSAWLVCSSKSSSVSLALT
jgi:hypothetical protein